MKLKIQASDNITDIGKINNIINQFKDAEKTHNDELTAYKNAKHENFNKLSAYIESLQDSVKSTIENNTNSACFRYMSVSIIPNNINSEYINNPSLYNASYVRIRVAFVNSIKWSINIYVYKNSITTESHWDTLKNASVEDLNYSLSVVKYVQSIHYSYWRDLYDSLVDFKLSESSPVRPSDVKTEYYCDKILEYMVGTNLLVKNMLFGQDTVTSPDKQGIGYVYYQILGITSQRVKTNKIVFYPKDKSLAISSRPGYITKINMYSHLSPVVRGYRTLTSLDELRAECN